MIEVRINRDKWSKSMVTIAGHRPVKKPLFKNIVAYPDMVAQELIRLGYVTPLNSEKKETTVEKTEVAIPSVVNQSLPIEKEVEKEVAEIQPEQVTEEAIESSEDQESLEEKMIAYFVENDSATISKNIRWIGKETAEKIKQLEELSYGLIEENLTDRQLESAIEFIQNKF